MRYLDAGLPPDRVTVSSDGGGCLPVFDAEGRVASHGRGPRRPPWATRCGRCSRCGQPLERVLPAFTSNPARLLLLAAQGAAGAPGPTPTWWCSTSEGAVAT